MAAEVFESRWMRGTRKRCSREPFFALAKRAKSHSEYNSRLKTQQPVLHSNIKTATASDLIILDRRRRHRVRIIYTLTYGRCYEILSSALVPDCFISFCIITTRHLVEFAFTSEHNIRRIFDPHTRSPPHGPTCLCTISTDLYDFVYCYKGIRRISS